MKISQALVLSGHRLPEERVTTMPHDSKGLAPDESHTDAVLPSLPGEAHRPKAAAAVLIQAT